MWGFGLDPPASTTIEQILIRALLRARVEKISLLLLLVYIDRLSKIGSFPVTKNSLHLLTTAALMCADKLVSDGYVVW